MALLCAYLSAKHCVHLATSWLWAEAVVVSRVWLQAGSGAGWVPSAVPCVSCVTAAQLSAAAGAARGCFCSDSDSSAGEQLHCSIQLLLLLQLHSPKGILKFQFKETILKINKLQEIFAHLLCGPQAVFVCRWFRGFFGVFFCLLISFSLQTLRPVQWW